MIRKLGLKRPGRAFYAIRHGFETVAGETADQIAIDKIMGHKTPGMSDAYTERISDEQRRRVVEHVRQWLFADTDPPVKKNSVFCGPCDPCDPAPENPENTLGSHGPQGSQNYVPAPTEDEQPPLRLFAG